MLRKIAASLPDPIQASLRRLRNGLKRTASLFMHGADLPTVREDGSPGPFAHVSDATRRMIQFDIWRNPDALLQMRLVREHVARDRALYFLSKDAIQKEQNASSSVARGTVEHNLTGARESADLDRPMTLVSTALGIEKIRKKAASVKVLSIGPRSEIEIFAIRGAGFRWENIKAIDLFSYSPFVGVGDVHAIPYPDNSFDLVFMGWVLAYSKNQAGAVAEVIRVLKPGGIAIVASDFSSEETHTRDRVDSTHMQNSDQMLALFGDHVRYVFARHDPEMPHTEMIMVAVEVKK